MSDRKTADALLDRGEWQAIRDWLIPQMGNTRGLQLDPEAAAPIRAVARKDRKTGQRDDIAIRLPRDQMEALREQMSFWEACQDELKAVVPGGHAKPIPLPGNHPGAGVRAVGIGKPQQAGARDQMPGLRKAPGEIRDRPGRHRPVGKDLRDGPAPGMHGPSRLRAPQTRGYWERIPHGTQPRHAKTR